MATSKKTAGSRKRKQPNLLLIGIDSLLATHMSCYGYHRQTTPHIDRFAKGGTLFENTFCPHVPTTPGYGSMLTGRDCFGTNCVALRHRGPMNEEAKTLAEVLGEEGYNTTSVGFQGNPAARGFQNYLHFGGWGSKAEGRSPKAQNLNNVTLPELARLADEDEPFFLFLRHMDPHSPYLPPEPYERMFYHGDECDADNPSMDPVMEFRPFRDYFLSWMPDGITDKDYVVAQYDGAIAYMDACIQSIFTELESLGILEETIVVINADHGETLYDHECWFDHHGIYDVTLRVPLIIRYPKKVPAGRRVKGFNQHKDLMPTLLKLLSIKTDMPFEGRDLMDLVKGKKENFDTEFYITECTWMRKHGWRTPEWKLIRALEPDFHFKPPVELYNLLADPDENNNLADKEPEVVAYLTKRMEDFIAKREKEEGRTNPMLTQGAWHGHDEIGERGFKSSQEAYDTMHIGDPEQAAKLQARAR
ncbi:MAG: sulfatase [Lentisphaerae bacterium]|jgi:arylsulfatase A-like enzyme|nr:sulfatase [Lentisphaerota bacterium]MBT5606895.1 sulfatase [Lentisphaerota bacterium]MBT7058341.1 sulfatase [Lentisphaerota bacterium]MBT7843614.1 sulfatase [Lentisphaerota bacterium]